MRVAILGHGIPISNVYYNNECVEILGFFYSIRVLHLPDATAQFISCSFAISSRAVCCCCQVLPTSIRLLRPEIPPSGPGVNIINEIESVCVRAPAPWRPCALGPSDSTAIRYWTMRQLRASDRPIYRRKKLRTDVKMYIYIYISICPRRWLVEPPDRLSTCSFNFYDSRSGGGRRRRRSRATCADCRASFTSTRIVPLFHFLRRGFQTKETIYDPFFCLLLLLIYK